MFVFGSVLRDAKSKACFYCHAKGCKDYMYIYIYIYICCWRVPFFRLVERDARRNTTSFGVSYFDIFICPFKVAEQSGRVPAVQSMRMSSNSSFWHCRLLFGCSARLVGGYPSVL